MGPPPAHYRHLAEAAVVYLEKERAPRLTLDVATQVMGAAFARQPAFLHIVEDLLGADERFSRDGDGHWRLAGWRAGRNSLVASASWTETAPLPRPRQYHTATVLTDGSVLVAAGLDRRDTPQHSATSDRYDPSQGVWLR